MCKGIPSLVAMMRARSTGTEPCRFHPHTVEWWTPATSASAFMSPYFLSGVVSNVLATAAISSMVIATTVDEQYRVRQEGA